MSEESAAGKSELPSPHQRILSVVGFWRSFARASRSAIIEVYEKGKKECRAEGEG